MKKSFEDNSCHLYKGSIKLTIRFTNSSQLKGFKKIGNHPKKFSSIRNGISSTQQVEVRTNLCGLDSNKQNNRVA